MRPSENRLHVHVLTAALGSGGGEAVVAEFATAAATAGIDCTVAYIGGTDGDGQAADRVRAAGVPVTHVPTSSLLGRRDIRTVRAHVAEVAPDLVHTHLDHADVLGGLAARRLGIPAVSTLHRVDIGPGLHRRAVRDVSALIRRRTADRIICVSDQDRRTLLRSRFERPRQVVSIRNAVGRERTPGAGRAIRAELGVADDAIVVTMVSVLRPEKGHDVALEAFADVRRRLPGAVLLIAGDGPEDAAVRATAAGLGDAVRVLGERADVMELLDASDVFIQPSRFEGLPMALLEAASAGVPMVATAVGGIPELVSERVGVLLGPAPEAGPLADAIVHLGEDAELRRTQGTAARELYEAEFTATAWVRKYRAVYDAIIGARG